MNDIEILKEKKHFSLSAFFIKMTSRAFLVFLIITVPVYFVLYMILTKQISIIFTWIGILLCIWGGVGLFYIGGNVLIDALAKMVEKANLTINSTISASANTNISGAASSSGTASANSTDAGGKK